MPLNGDTPPPEPAGDSDCHSSGGQVVHAEERRMVAAAKAVEDASPCRRIAPGDRTQILGLHSSSGGTPRIACTTHDAEEPAEEQGGISFPGMPLNGDTPSPEPSEDSSPCRRTFPSCRRTFSSLPGMPLNGDTPSPEPAGDCHSSGGQVVHAEEQEDISFFDCVSDHTSTSSEEQAHTEEQRDISISFFEYVDCDVWGSASTTSTMTPLHFSALQCLGSVLERSDPNKTHDKGAFAAEQELGSHWVPLVEQRRIPAQLFALGSDDVWQAGDFLALEEVSSSLPSRGLRQWQGLLKAALSAASMHFGALVFGERIRLVIHPDGRRLQLFMGGLWHRYGWLRRLFRRHPGGGAEEQDHDQTAVVDLQLPHDEDPEGPPNRPSTILDFEQASSGDEPEPRRALDDPFPVLNVDGLMPYTVRFLRTSAPVVTTNTNTSGSVSSIGGHSIGMATGGGSAGWSADASYVYALELASVNAGGTKIGVVFVRTTRTIFDVAVGSLGAEAGATFLPVWSRRFQLVEEV